MVASLSQRERYKTNGIYSYKDVFSLGPWTTQGLLSDPVHLGFVLSRYKFVARMLSGKTKVLEVGCGDAFGTPVVAQFVKSLLAVDIDERIISSNKKRLKKFKNLEFAVWDCRTQSVRGKFDAAYAIDVIEHIEPPITRNFIKNITDSLVPDGVCILGTPNKTSGKYASTGSRKYHINLQTFEGLKSLLSQYFQNVFMFSMNDEVVHTGFGPMAHYLFGLGAGVKRWP